MRASPREAKMILTTLSPNLPVSSLSERIFCESVVEPPGPLALSAGRKGDDLWDRDSLDKFEALLRTESAAIETEVKDARPRTTGGASSKAATSNTPPDSTGKLKPRRHRVKAPPSGPVGIADKTAALRHSLSVRVGVVIVGLAGLGAGMVFWHNASRPLGASAIKAQTEPAKRLSQDVTGVDTPTQDSAIVDPPPAAPVDRHEQAFAASQPKTPSAIDPRDEGELTNQSASAPIPPAPTQTQAEPVGMAASPMTEKAETLFGAAIHCRNSSLYRSSTSRGDPFAAAGGRGRGATAQAKSSGAEDREACRRGQIEQSQPSRTNRKTGQDDCSGNCRQT